MAAVAVESGAVAVASSGVETVTGDLYMFKKTKCNKTDSIYLLLYLATAIMLLRAAENHQADPSLIRVV